MIKEKIQKLKESLKNKEGENNKKTIENLVVFVIILIITIVAINYIWSDKTKTEKQNNEANKRLASEDSLDTAQTSTTENTTDNGIEERLENILGNIKGVGKVKVLITYSQTSQVIPMYDEDYTTSTTEEADSGGGTRTINETSTKKDIIYEENNGVKTPITQSIINPKIEGAIITAQGATNAEIKTNIIQAVEAVTGLATYKIQVFEME